MFRNVFYKPRLLATLVSATLVLLILVPQISLAQQGTVARAMSEVLWSVVNNVFGWMVGIGGGLLDSAITTYVVGFGELYRTSGLGFSIDSLWSTVRDIFNLTFIFGLVYIGFKMIFNSGDSGAKRMLGSLVLAALLVNFSLFITKFIIDFSNIAATQFAQAFSTSTGVYSVSNGFMQLFGLTKGFDALPPGAGFTYIFGMLFLYLIAAFVFAAGGLLLIIRFVVLNIYMILSPLMFLGMVFPGMRGVSSKYWEGFLGRAFFAPAYLLMLYFAHQILVNMQGVATAGSANLATAFSSSGANRYDASISVIPFFILIAGFLIAALVVAQKMGAEGATSAIAVGKRMSGRARKMAVGGASYTAGILPRKAVNSIGEGTQKRLNNLQTKNYKNSGVVAGTLGAISRTNIADKAVRGGAVSMASAKLGTGSTNAEGEAYKKKTISRANQTAAENARTTSYKANLSALSDTTKSATDLSTALDDLGKSIRGMSKDEKNGLDLSELTNKSVAINLSDDDVKNLDSSGNFSAAEIQSVKDARKHGFMSIATHGSTLTNTDSSGKVTDYSIATAGIHDTVTGKGVPAAGTDKRQSLFGKGTKEAGNLPVDVFKEPTMFDHITPAVLEERLKNGVSAADLIAIKSALYTRKSIPAGDLPSDVLTKEDPWVKWEGGSSVYAAQFFA